MLSYTIRIGAHADRVQILPSGIDVAHRYKHSIQSSARVALASIDGRIIGHRSSKGSYTIRIGTHTDRAQIAPIGIAAASRFKQYTQPSARVAPRAIEGRINDNRSSMGSYTIRIGAHTERVQAAPLGI